MMGNVHVKKLKVHVVDTCIYIRRRMCAVIINSTLQKKIIK